MTKFNQRIRVSTSYRLLAALVAFGLAGCDLFTAPEDPATLTEESIQDSDSFDARLVGAVGDFADAVDDAVVTQALFTDLLVWGGTVEDRGEIDQRRINPDNTIVSEGPWTTLQIAVSTSGDLKQDMADFTERFPDPQNSAEFARLSLMNGYAKLYIADLFCTAAFDGTGPELSSEDVYQLAIDEFSSALAADNVTESVRNAAHVGLARAELQLGNRQRALQEAQQVDQGFEVLVEYSGRVARQDNDVWDFTWNQERMSVADQWRNPVIDDSDVEDPRVQAFDTGGLSFAGSVEQFNPTKYSERTTSIRLASWIEAQYIIALLEGGETAVDIMNSIREQVGIDDDVPQSGDEGQDVIRLKVIDEKARTLFVEGQRLADLRRLRAQFGTDLFPTGSGFGDQTCMPLPDDERDNNPDI